MYGANHGKSEDCRKDGAEMCPGCIKETRMNDPDTKTDMPFIGTFWKTRGWRVPVTGQTIYPG